MAVESIEASLANEAKLLRDSADETHALQKTIDISDSGQLARMTSLLTIEAVGQARRGFRHQEMEAAQKALVDASAHFAKTALAPRCQQLESRARAKVSDKLKKHFPDDDARQSAVQHSPEFAALAPIEGRAVVRDYSPDGAIRQAKVLLDAWTAADAFEQQFLS